MAANKSRLNEKLNAISFGFTVLQNKKEKRGTR
jgi:hypothetical protein